MKLTQVKIGEVAEINPRVPKELVADTDRDVDFIPMAQLSEQGFVTPNGTRKLGEVIKGYNYFENGDVLVAKITPCMENGKAAYVRGLPQGVAFGSTEFLVIRPGKELDGRYLFYMIWNDNFRHIAERHMTGTAGQKRVSKDFLSRFPIPLPPIKEQKRIASILDKCHRIRGKRLLAVNKTKELLRSQFLSLVGDPFLNTLDWPSQTLFDLMDVRTGKLDANAAVEGGQYPFFTCSREDYAIDIHAFDCEALILSGNNASADYSVKFYSGKFNAYQRTYVLTLKNAKHSYPFFKQLLEYKLNEMKQNSRGTNTKYLTLEFFKRFELLVPSETVQKKYEIHANGNAKLSKKLSASLRKTNSLFDSLLQRAFKGQL